MEINNYWVVFFAVVQQVNIIPKLLLTYSYRYFVITLLNFFLTTFIGPLAKKRPKATELDESQVKQKVLEAYATGSFSKVNVAELHLFLKTQGIAYKSKEKKLELEDKVRAALNRP